LRVIKTTRKVLIAFPVHSSRIVTPPYLLYIRYYILFGSSTTIGALSLLYFLDV